MLDTPPTPTPDPPRLFPVFAYTSSENTSFNRVAKARDGADLYSFVVQCELAEIEIGGRVRRVLVLTEGD